MSQEVSIWTVAGKPRLKFKSPQEMWEVACKYFEWSDNHPLYKSEQLKKPGKDLIVKDSKGIETVVHGETLVEMPLKRSYSQWAFAVVSGCHEDYLRNMIHDIKRFHTKDGKVDEDQKEWIFYAKKIITVINTQQYEAAAAGQLESNIVTRMIGLADRQVIEQTNTEVKQVFKIDDLEFEIG